MNVRTCFIALALSVTALGVLEACGGDSATLPPGPKGAATAPDATEGGAPAAIPPRVPGATPDAGGAACSTKTTLAACQSCCYETHPSGSTYLVQQMAACECGPKGPCDAPCGDTLCATPLKAASAACTQCVGGNITTTCASVLSDCSAVPDCAGVLSCLQSCVGK